MRGDQFGQVVGDQCVIAHGEARLGLGFESGETLLLQPVLGGAGEGFVGEVGERRATPQRERVRQQPGTDRRVPGVAGAGGQLVEAPGVDSAGPGEQAVAVPLRGHEVTAARLGLLQRPAELPHLVLQRGGRVGGQPAPPQLLDQPVDGQRLTMVRQQAGEQGTDL